MEEDSDYTIPDVCDGFLDRIKLRTKLLRFADSVSLSQQESIGLGPSNWAYFGKTAQALRLELNDKLGVINRNVMRSFFNNRLVSKSLKFSQRRRQRNDSHLAMKPPHIMRFLQVKVIYFCNRNLNCMKYDVYEL